MHFSLLSMLAVGTGSTNTSFLVAIALLACLLGAEIAGICILIAKMLRARRERYRREELDVDGQNSNYHYSMAPVALFAAIPQSTYTALTLLSALTVLGAIVFVVLLIVCRAKGYDFASSASYHAAQTHGDESKVSSVKADEPVYATLETTYPDEGEEQRQDAYTPEREEDESPLDAFEDEIAENVEPSSEEDGTHEVVEGELVQAPVAVASAEQGATVTEMRTGPVFADGTQPYKVVEKVVTEKVTEVYKETPAENKGTTNDQVLEKLVDLLDYEIRSRREPDKNENGENESHGKNETVATFAESPIPDEEDEDDEDENEDDELDESVDGRSEDEEDRDDEENDTDGDHFTGNERIIGFDEETGCYIVAHYRKSFEAKLIQSRPNIKKYYSDLKNALLSYKGTKSRISWTADSFHNGRTPIAKINVKTRILELYLAIDPASLEGTVYRGHDVGSKKKYADTPFRYKLRTPRKFKWALELIQRTCEEHGLSPIDIEHVNYDEQYPFDTTENLVERKLIKEYIRQEKPAATFELDPDHAPIVPDEDESVIPANANFSWEFDNERMEVQEPEPEEEPTPEPEPEPTPEPEPAPAPDPAPAPAPQASIVRETVKVTEMRYTERYYANAEPTYEQVITTTEPIAVLSEPVTETEEEAVQTVEEASVNETTYESVEEETDTEESVEAVEVYEDAEPEELFFDGEQTAEETEGFDVTENTDAEGYPFRPSFYADSTYEAEAVDTEELMAEETDTEAEEPIEVEEEIEAEEEDTPKKTVNPAIAVVDICSLEDHFDAGDVIDLNALKEKNLILPGATTLKIYASGELSKSFTVEAHQFTMDAIKAISDADGDSVMVR